MLEEASCNWWLKCIQGEAAPKQMMMMAKTFLIWALEKKRCIESLSMPAPIMPGRVPRPKLNMHRVPVIGSTLAADHSNTE